MQATVTRSDVEQHFTAALMDFGVEADEIDNEVPFDALDVDSLDLVEIVQGIEEEYGVSITTADMFDLQTIGQAIDLVVRRTW